MRANTEPMLDAQNTLAFGQDVNASGGRLPERAAIQYHRPCRRFQQSQYQATPSPPVRAAPLLAQYRLVNLPGGEIVLAAHSGLHKAFIMAEIKIRLRAVFGHEYF